MPRSAEQAARDLLERFTQKHGVHDVVAFRAGLHLPGFVELLGLEQQDVPEIVIAGQPYIGQLDPSNRLLVVSEAYPKMRTFTIAHELGHHELHPRDVSYRDRQVYLLGPQRNRPKETEANRFATVFLMPDESMRLAYYSRFERPFVRGSLSDEQLNWLRVGNRHKFSREQIERMSLRDLARLVAACELDYAPLRHDFGVSKETMAIRLEELGFVSNGKPQYKSAPRVVSTSLPPLVVAPKLDVQPRQASLPQRAPRTVVLIGEHGWHARNRVFLKRHEWIPIDDESPSAVEKLWDDPPCGVVVHPSFWKHLPREEWKDTFRALVELSSFIFVRVDLGDASELAGTALAELPPPVVDQRSAGLFRQTADGSLDQVDDQDLFALKRVFDLREKEARVVLATDAPADTRLLKLIAAERFEAGAEQPDMAVAAKRLVKGNSGARGYAISIDGDQKPVFVKVGETRALAAELERTREFERHLPGIPIPELRFHGRVGALVQPLITAGRDSVEPAPSLEDFLQDLSLERAQVFLESILPSILTTFSGLASQRTGQAARHLAANLLNYKLWVKDGVPWVQSPLGPESIDPLAEQALHKLDAFDAAALVHGDAHLRNILLRNGTEPVLVDFANAGPGHPLLDFVRLELGIWTVLLKRANRDKAQSLVSELLAHETVTTSIGGAFKTSGDELDVALQASTMIRERCRAAMLGDRSWFEQYRSMHVLLALLAIRRPQDQYLSFAVFAATRPRKH